MNAKTKAQLLVEIETLQKRIAELQTAEVESHYKKQATALSERVKELNCLYSISHLVETPGISLLDILQGCVELLPPAWQYPQITCARIVLKYQEYKTGNFRETKWKLASEIKVEGKSMGTVEVFYLDQQPKEYHGPFLKEERTLIDAVADRLGNIIHSLQAQQEIEMLLALSRQAAAETNLEDLLFFIANQIVEVIPHAEASAVFLYDEERKVVRIQAWAGYDGSDVKGIEFKVAGSQIGRIFRAKKPVMIKNVSEDPDFILIDKPGTREIKSQIAVPLIFKKRVVGIIYADNLTRTNAFSQKNQDFLESIGNQLSGVIENARLLDQVREKEEQYKSVVEDSPGLIDRFLIDGTITFVNQESCRFFGKKYDELIGTNITSQILEEDREKVMSGIASLTVESPVRTFENKVIRYDGEIRWMRWTDHALFDNKGKINSIQSFGEDITEWVLAQEKLKISEERFRAFMENVPAFAYILNKDLHHIYGNPASIAADGYSTLEDYIGTSIKTNYPDEISDEIEANSKRVLDEGCVTHHEFSTTMRNGKSSTLLDIKFPIHLPDEDTHVGGLAIDITERIQAQEAIRQEKDKAQKYLDIAEVMIVALNKEGEITLVNQKGASILGYQIEELIGKNWFDTFLPRREHESGKKKYIELITGKTDVSDHFEETIVTRSGEERIIDWHGTPLRDEEKHTIGILSSGEDITERIQAQEAIRQEQEKAQKYLDVAGVIMLALNKKGDITLINQKGNQVLGYQGNELTGANWFDTCLPERNRKEVKGVFRKLMTGDIEPVEYYESPILTSSGEERTIAWYNTVLRDKKGNSIGTLSSGEDITEHMREEQLLDILNQAAVSMETAHTPQDVIKVVGEGLKQINISCMLFLLDETQSKLIIKYMSHEPAILNAAEKLLGVSYRDFSFHIDAVDVCQEVIRKKKTIYEESSKRILQQVFPKFAEILSMKIKKSHRVEKSTFAPLVVDNQVIGIFSMQSLDLIQEDIPIVTAFTHQLAGAWNKTRLLQDLRKTVDGTIHTIAATVEARDPYTAGHQKRVADLAAAIASDMGLASDRVEGIKMAGVIHDLGKVQIPAEILSKPGKISELEYKIIQTHPQVGFDLLKEIEFPWPIDQMILQHHEMMDGSGYPQGLKGDEILLEARILAVADMVEAMASHRPYRPAHGIEKALKQIRQNKGTLLDPKVVDACLMVFKEGYKLLEN